MIFLSHNHADKPVIEPIAIRLKEIFGEDKVFYDSWSMQPGDGIIEKMNEGLTSPKFVFFFVSAKSLMSNMVKLEWQNALYKSTKGNCKIIPVRVDGSEMPAILMQNLYIDLFAQGIEAAIVQIVSVIQGNNTFTPQHLGFSNLTYKVEGDLNSLVTITISASHLMEPNPAFVILLSNEESEVKVGFEQNAPHIGGFNEGVKLSDGSVANGIAIAPLGGAITPAIPMKIQLTANSKQPIGFIGVLHKSSYDKYTPIPPAA